MPYDGLILLEDSRQQEAKHKIKHQWFAENGVHWNRCSLPCGDYQLPGDGAAAIDTKNSIQELIGDIQYRAMPKKEVRENLDRIAYDFFLGAMTESVRDELYHIITDDDSYRFPEKEISDCCRRHGIPERAMREIQGLYVKRHGFFHRGLVRAQNYGVDLCILVDNRDGVTDIDSLFRWVNPRRRIMVNTSEQIGRCRNGRPKYRRVQKYPDCMMGDQLARACLTMEKKYGCTFRFCRPEDSGRIIVELLTGGRYGDGGTERL